ncbi:MAG: glutathione peroxidase, partial [Sphingobacteriales bacterium]
MHLILCLFANMLIQSALYELPLQRIDGTSINLQTYQGKKILFVNTASGSPLASQYAGLDSLQRLYADSLVVIVLPSNSFGNEPLTPVSIGTSLEAAYHPQFIIGEK